MIYVVEEKDRRLGWYGSEGMLCLTYFQRVRVCRPTTVLMESAQVKSQSYSNATDWDRYLHGLGVDWPLSLPSTSCSQSPFDWCGGR